MAFFYLTTISASLVAPSAEAWSNGGFSTDPSAPKYGTHDWLAHHALDWIPDDSDFWIRDNLAVYLYGTELPDNKNAPLGDGIGDTIFHHVYYRSTGQLQDDASGRRAREACQESLSYIISRDYRNAAKWMGIAVHYIADIAVFGHVMGSSTDWGSEKHHSDYETWVNSRTDNYSSSFMTYLRFDGSLESISAYDAALKLSHDTTFDDSGKGRTAKWMDDNYDTDNAPFKDRVGESLNLATNLLAEVIYGTSDAAGIPEFTMPATALGLSLIVAIVLIRKKRASKSF
jgi:hypothetical protein